MAYAAFKDPADLTNGDMVVFDAGRLDIYNKIDGVRSTVPTTPLKKYKAGSAPIGSWTELPGYWQEQPQVLVSVKKIPTYYARGRLGQQKFTLSCEVQPTGTALKYRIRPLLTFYITGGASGTETVNESNETGIYDDFSSDIRNGSLTFGTRVTTPQPGAGTLTVSISWMTRARGTNKYINNDERFQWTTNTQIYIDMFKVSSSGEISVGSQRLVNETNVAYGQAVQTQTFSGIDLGSGTCSWRLRKTSQAVSVANVDASNTDMSNLLRLNSYSYTTSAETLTNPTGEVFYLAIGR